MSTAIVSPALRFAIRERAPDTVTSEVADMDPATGMPWKTPAATLAMP